VVNIRETEKYVNTQENSGFERALKSFNGKERMNQRGIKNLQSVIDLEKPS
jgi:hypothetical protein